MNKQEKKAPAETFMGLCMNDQETEKGKPHEQAVAICMSLSRRMGDDIGQLKEWIAQEQAKIAAKKAEHENAPRIDIEVENTLSGSYIDLKSP